MAQALEGRPVCPAKPIYSFLTLMTWLPEACGNPMPIASCNPFRWDVESRIDKPLPTERYPGVVLVMGCHRDVLPGWPRRVIGADLSTAVRAGVEQFITTGKEYHIARGR